MGLDKGIIRGVTKGLGKSRSVLEQRKGNRRKPISVYSKIAYAQIMKLGELLTNQYDHAGTQIIVDKIQE